MKTVKKLLSLMLVAILLVSAVPFQASAAGYQYTVTMSGYSFTCYDNNGWVTPEELAENLAEDESEMEEALEYVNSLNITFNVNVQSGLTDINLDTGVVSEKQAAAPEVTTPTGSGSQGGGSLIETIAPVATTEAPTTEATTTETTAPGGNTQGGGQGGTQEQSYTVIIDYTDGAEGEPAQVYTMKAGVAYGNRLPANPQRNAMTFRYWVYRGTNTVVTADSLVDASKANANNEIYIDAVWNVQTLTLELIDIRGTDPAITKIKAVKVGQPIGELPTPTREGYIFVGWKLNGQFITKDTIWTLGDSATAYAIWAMEGALPGQLIPEEDGKVYLEIYLNGDWNLAKRVDISAYVGKNDEVITRAEVQKVVTKYYSPKAGYTLKYIGLFDEQSWYEYTRDQETDGAESIQITMLDGDIKKDHYIYVMVTNVKVPVADSTNPKTGDAILGVVATMFTSGAAALYLEQKKRKQF